MIKCGYVKGPVVVFNYGVGASEVFKDLCGKFVKMDGSGRVEVAVAASTSILGHAECGEFTASSTEGASKVDVNVSREAVYLIPACKAAGAAVSEAELLAIVGETCDIQMVDTNYQYCDISASATDVLEVLGYKYEGSAAGQQFVYVRINPSKTLAGNS